MVIFADGSVHECSKFLLDPGIDWLYVLLDGATWLEAAEIGSNPEKTSCMTCGIQTMVGYTHLRHIAAEPGGIKLCLSKA